MVREQELAFARERQAAMSNGRLFGDSLNRREALRLLSYSSLLLCDLASIQAGFAIASHWRGAYWLQLYGFPVSILFGLTYTFLALTSGSVTRDAFGSRLRSAMLGERTLLMASALCIAFLFFQPQGLTLSRLSLLTAMILSGVLMLKYLGEDHPAQRLEDAVKEVLAEGKYVTYDLKPNRDDPTSVGTSQMAEAIIARLK